MPDPALTLASLLTPYGLFTMVAVSAMFIGLVVMGILFWVGESGSREERIAKYLLAAGMPVCDLVLIVVFWPNWALCVLFAIFAAASLLIQISPKRRARDRQQAAALEELEQKVAQAHDRQRAAALKNLERPVVQLHPDE